MTWDEIVKKLRFENGIFFSDTDMKVSYPNEGNNQYFQIEDASFWFSHRASAIVQLVKNESPAGMIFDVGGGNGHVASALEKNGFETVLVEPGLQGIHNAKQRGLKRLICGTLESAGFVENSLPAIGLFDVLEHVEEDKKFLQSVCQKLQPGGMLYLTVPAYQALWSSEDESAGHFRRYSLNNISSLVESAGFRVSQATYIFSFLPAPIFLFRSVPYALKISRAAAAKEISRDHKVAHESLTQLLHKVFQTEISFIRKKKKILFGGSCLVAARAVK